MKGFAGLNGDGQQRVQLLVLCLEGARSEALLAAVVRVCTLGGDGAADPCFVGLYAPQERVTRVTTFGTPKWWCWWW
jgi:hypothetical protein